MDVLILVSHDRYFLDKLTDHLFIFEGEGRVRDYYGRYSKYSFEQEAKKQSIEKQDKKKITQAVKKSAAKTKLSFNEKREYENLEKDIEKLEAEKAKAEAKLNSGTIPYEELTILSERIGELIELIDEKTLRWMELDEFA